MDCSALWATQLTHYGLLFVTSVPNEKASHDQCDSLRKLGESEIRQTFSRTTWDVKDIKSSPNIVYVSIDLGRHMDHLSVHPQLTLRRD